MNSTRQAILILLITLFNRDILDCYKQSMLFDICPICRLVRTTVVVYVLQDISAALTQDDYYTLSREKAINEHDEILRHSTRLKSISEIGAAYFPDTPSWISKNPLQCPETKNILSDGPIKVCPSYLVMDVDQYRKPMIIFQVKCRCLYCQHSWFGSHEKLCQPLFEFLKVDRVTGIDGNGTYIHNKVWEPVSNSCVCRKRPGRHRLVMSL